MQMVTNTLFELIGTSASAGAVCPGAGVLAKLESFNPLSSARTGQPLHDFGRRGEACSSPGAVIVGVHQRQQSRVALAYIGRQRSTSGGAHARGRP